MKQKDFSMSQREAREWEPDFDIKPKIRPERATRGRIGLGYTPVEGVSDHNVSSFGAVETNINMPAPASEKDVYTKHTHINGEPTISSREIAELTGKQHTHVLEAIRVMEPAWHKIGQSKFRLTYYKDQWNRQQPQYQLSKIECLYVATKFNDEARARLIIRWEELEKAAVTPTMDFSNPETVRMLANNWADAEQRCLALKKENKAKQKQICQMMPLAEHAEELMKSDSCLTTTQIAAELGISARKLNENLRGSGVQYRCNGQWILYSKYKDMGLTRTRTTEYRGTDGSIKTAHNTVWTEKGRFFIHDRFM